MTQHHTPPSSHSRGETFSTSCICFCSECCSTYVYSPFGELRWPSCATISPTFASGSSMPNTLYRTILVHLQLLSWGSLHEHIGSHSHRTQAFSLLPQRFVALYRWCRPLQKPFSCQLGHHRRLKLVIWALERRVSRWPCPGSRHRTPVTALFQLYIMDRRSSIWPSHRYTPCSICACSWWARSSH